MFGCVPSSPPVSADKLLAKLLEVARDTLPRLWVPGKTILTVERDVLHGTMREAVTRANELLANAATEFESCTWRPAFWRDPRLDQFYGGLRSPNGIRRRGQYLDISAHYALTLSAVGGRDAPPPVLKEVAIGFTLELAGGAKTYRAEWLVRDSHAHRLEA